MVLLDLILHVVENVSISMFLLQLLLPKIFFCKCHQTSITQGFIVVITFMSVVPQGIAFVLFFCGKCVKSNSNFNDLIMGQFLFTFNVQELPLQEQIVSILDLKQELTHF